MIVEDVTPKQPSGRKRKRQSSKKPSKVLLSEFEVADAVALATLGRQIYRFHACIDNAFPDDETLHYAHVYKHVSALEDTSMAEALKRVGQNEGLRKRLLGYVRLFSSSNSSLSHWSADVLWNRSRTN